MNKMSVGSYRRFKLLNFRTTVINVTDINSGLKWQKLPETLIFCGTVSEFLKF
jgi:hypothetical protein